MKKFFIYLPLAALLFAAACGDNDDDVIAEPYVIEISEYVDYPPYKVERNTVTTVYAKKNLLDKSIRISSTDCVASELKIELPGVLANKYLIKANGKNLFDNCSVSDEKAMIGFVSFYVLMEDNFNTGIHNVFDNDDDDFYQGQIIFCYVDRDVDIKGSNEIIDGINYYGNIIRKYDLKLKKGWNKIALRLYRDSSRPYPYLYEPAYLYYSMDVPDNTYWRVMSLS